MAVINPTPKQVIRLVETGKLIDTHCSEKIFLNSYLRLKNLKLDDEGLLVLLNDNIIQNEDFARIRLEVQNNIY